MQPDILQVRGLRVHYHTPRGAIRAVDGVSFDLRRGERLGLVGESGSGKSTVALALLRLIKPPGRIEAGEARLDGVDLLAVPEKEMRRLRLAAIALVARVDHDALGGIAQIGGFNQSAKGDDNCGDLENHVLSRRRASACVCLPVRCSPRTTSSSTAWVTGERSSCRASRAASGK